MTFKKYYPCIYQSGTKDFTHNGEGTLIDIIDPIVTMERNSLFEFEFKYPLSGKRFKFIKELNIIKANASQKIRNQRFVIYNISKPINGIVTVKCLHKTMYDLLKDTINVINLTNVSCTAALQEIFDQSKKNKHLKAISDIESIGNFNQKFISCLECIKGTQGSIIDTFGNGADIIFDNDSVSIKQHSGVDTNILIAYGKNMIDYNETSDVMDIITFIRPYARIIGENQEENYLTLDNYGGVESKYINNYEEVYEAWIDFTDKAETIEDLIKIAEEYFLSTKCDLPKGNYKIDFVELSKTENYKAFKAVNTLNIFDTAIIRNYKYNIDVTSKIIKTKFDPVNDKYVGLEFGDIKGNLGNIVGDINSDIDNIHDNNNNINDFINNAIDHATDVITGDLGGHVKLVPKDHPSEIFIMDTDDVNTAKQVLRINKSGIGFSNNGVNGPFATAWTLDGGFVADFITSGLLNANLLKVGSIKSIGGSLEINLENADGIMTRYQGKNSINISNQSIYFYDWDGEGNPVGLLYTAHLVNTDISGLAAGHNVEQYYSLSHQLEPGGNVYGQYIIFDKSNVIPTNNVPITICEDTEFKGSEFWLRYGINSIYTSDTNNFVLRAINNFLIAERSNGNVRASVGKNQIYCYDTDTTKPYFWAAKNGFSFWVNEMDAIFYSTTGKFVSKIPTVIESDLNVTGNKNCVQETQNYGHRLFYSTEDCESYLTDRSIHLLTVEETKDGTFERVILLDPIYKESVNLDLDYSVEILKQGWGDFRIKEQTKDYFIVEADRVDFTFKYIITAKRKGFEDQRNNEFFIHSELLRSEENLISEENLSTEICENKGSDLKHDIKGQTKHRNNRYRSSKRINNKQRGSKNFRRKK